MEFVGVVANHLMMALVPDQAEHARSAFMKLASPLKRRVQRLIQYGVNVLHAWEEQQQLLKI